ncbi:ABC transporter permease [Variovorax sp.]|uniref:ABC transporter permease n=1 Tax=Variovorax sp. TaxID=1871043 RepID=UPI002D6BFD45|nr:ABC transporter permease subunit [Variovorax sp.]HYP83088.1 ABC transporter permease subunit [Variovorax sp.]
MHKPDTNEGTRLWPVTLASVMLILCAWEAASRRAGSPEYFLGPLEIVGAAVARLVHGDVLEPAVRSISRAFGGFALGGALGVALGLLSGVSRTVRDLFDVPQAFVHAIPKISLFPAVAVWLGFTDTSRILIIALSCFFPAYLNAMSGALGINPRYLWLSRNNEVSRLASFFQVVLPASLLRTMVGLRISLMVAFILMVATEVVGHSDGLGTIVMESYQEGDYRQMYAAILYIALAGYLSNLALESVARRLCRGQAMEFGG